MGGSTCARDRADRIPGSGAGDVAGIAFGVRVGEGSGQCDQPYGASAGSGKVTLIAIRWMEQLS
jgi:hypothetical protein